LGNPEEAEMQCPSWVTEVYQVSLCPSCIMKYPPAILKAMGDPFIYAIGLRDGTVLFIECVTEIHGDWITVRLSEETSEHVERMRRTFPPCPRGLNIRLSDIVWAADAPYGS
jgi:hypothetical protein